MSQLRTTPDRMDSTEQNRACQGQELHGATAHAGIAGMAILRITTKDAGATEARSKGRTDGRIKRWWRRRRRQRLRQRVYFHKQSSRVVLVSWKCRLEHPSCAPKCACSQCACAAFSQEQDFGLAQKAGSSAAVLAGTHLPHIQGALLGQGAWQSSLSDSLQPTRKSGHCHTATNLYL